MRMPPSTTCFFDVSSTLAFVLLSADGKQITELAPNPGVHPILRELTDGGVHVGAIFGCGEVPEEEVRAALSKAHLSHFGDRLLVVPERALMSDIFEGIAASVRKVAGCEGAPRLFVGTDETMRGMAVRAGFLTAPHAELVYSVLRNDSPLSYLRIKVPAARYGRDWVPTLRAHRVVPLHVTAELLKDAATTIYAIADLRTAAALDDLGFLVDRLGAPGEPQVTSLYLIRDDLQTRHGFLEPGGNSSMIYARDPDAYRVLASTHEGILVALSGDTSVESFRLIGPHDSHAQKLLPSLHLLQDRRTVAARATVLPHAAAAAPLCAREREVLCRHFAPAFMSATVATYAGTGAAGAGGLIWSRHVKHGGNQTAVETLVDELEKIAPGRIKVERHCFTHAGAQLTNVVATLPSSRMFGEGVVVISAHLDSTADRDGGNYDAATHRAPGADDDASGMAAVLGAVHAFAELASLGLPHREVRFALFNCEEIDKSGSGTYTSGLATCGVEIAATFHIDMIGYHRKNPACFEVHAGFYSPEAPNATDAANRSAEQAKLMEHLRPMLTTLQAAQISTT